MQSVLDAGADTIHFDVMDNHYVPNLSVGPLVLSSLRKAGFDCTIDAHLMVKPVDRLIGDFVEAGSGLRHHSSRIYRAHASQLEPDSRGRRKAWHRF